MEHPDRVDVEVRQGRVPTYWIIGLLVFANTMICYFDRVNAGTETQNQDDNGLPTKGYEFSNDPEEGAVPIY